MTSCETEFHLKKDLDETLSEFEKWEKAHFSKEFKDTVKVLDNIIGKEEDMKVAGDYIRGLLTCIMYWTAKKIRSWSEEVTKEVKCERFKTAHKLTTLLFHTIGYIHMITYLSDRCIELLLKKEE